MPNGQIPPKICANFGGEFSLFQKIRMGGVGSPKIIFQANTQQINELQLFEEIPIYANLELLKTGFALRMWQHRAFRAIVFGLDEPTQIEWQPYHIQTNKPNVFAADLFFRMPTQDLAVFIPPNSYRKMTQFIQKIHFKHLIIREQIEKNPEDITIMNLNILSFLQN